MKKDKIIIIAEAGVNHNGKLSLAKKLVSEAAKSGADYIKFQTFETESMVKPSTRLANYQKSNLKGNLSQFDMLKKYELKKKDYKILIKFAKNKNIKFISSPFDINSINFLKKFNLDFIKIPSGEINNFPYLRAIGKLKRKVILSTGMSTLGEISYALKILRTYGTKKNKITLLHCHSDYPSRSEDLNLKAIITLQKYFKINVGYSDHSKGIIAPLISIAMGARIIEKHLTLSTKMIGPDHKASINPTEFKEMVNYIRETEKMLGNGKKIPSKHELRNKPIVRKSLFAKIDIKKGERFSEKNLTTKRPEIGLSPSKYLYMLNRISKKNYKKNNPIK